MDPFERLRWVARGASSGSADVAVDAAPAFSALAGEPGALLTAARRLLDFHPACGPLWWLSAQVLAADDADLAVAFATAELEEDPTARHAERAIASRAPAVVAAVAAPGEHVVPALAGSPPPSIRVVGERWATRRVIAALAEDAEGVREVTGWSELEVDEALERAELVLVDVLAAGPAGVVTPPGGAALTRAAAHHGVPVWAVGGAGRVLPAALYELLVSRVGEELADVVGADRLGAYVGPHGTQDAAAALAASDCPVPVELLRRAR